MAAKVIHFGTDDCYRLRVLRRAGYDITDCGNLAQFRAALRPDAGADAVILNDGDGSLPELAIALAHSQQLAPVVLFPSPERSYDARQLDLVVAVCTPPEEWLLALANLIVNRRALDAYSALFGDRPDLVGKLGGSTPRNPAPPDRSGDEAI